MQRFHAPFCSITNARHSQSRRAIDKTRRRMPNENRSNFSLRIANEHVIRFTRKYIRKRTSRRRGDTRRTYDNGGVRINILALHVCACVMERRGYRSQLRCINSLRVDTRWCTLCRE